MIENIKKTCEIHNLEYEAKHIKFLNMFSKCPECKKEQEFQEKEKKEIENRLNSQKEAEYLKKYIKVSSNIPLRYTDFKANIEMENFNKYKSYLNEKLSNNLFIIGDTGTGKTLFLSKVLINNADKFPIYLNANDIALMQENDFRVSNILDKIDKKGIVAIDEVQMLIFGKRYLLMDAIIDRAYNQGSVIIFSGNITKKGLEVLGNNEWKRITSRFKQNGVSILDFGNKDLR